MNSSRAKAYMCPLGFPHNAMYRRKSKEYLIIGQKNHLLL